MRRSACRQKHASADELAESLGYAAQRDQEADKPGAG